MQRPYSVHSSLFRAETKGMDMPTSKYIPVAYLKNTFSLQGLINKRNSLAIPWKLCFQAILFRKPISPITISPVVLEILSSPPLQTHCFSCVGQIQQLVYLKHPFLAETSDGLFSMTVFPSCLMLCPSNETELEQSFLLELKSNLHFKSRQ